MVSFDPATLNAHAARVAASAAVLADLQAQLRQLGTSMSWRSPAARAFADALGALLARTDASRRLSVDLADALRRHGQVASRRAEDLAHVGAVIDGAVDQLGSLL